MKKRSDFSIDFFVMFLIVDVFFGFVGQVLKFLVEKTCFSASPGKAMLQNHLEISSKSQCWIRNVEIGGKHKETIPFLNAFLR